MTIKEALERARVGDAESLEALTRALLRGGHGPDVARVRALVEGEIQMRHQAARVRALVEGEIQMRHQAALEFEEAQRRQKRERQHAVMSIPRGLERESMARQLDPRWLGIKSLAQCEYEYELMEDRAAHESD